MKKRTLSKLKSLFSSKKGKHSRQPSNKSSRTPSPAGSPQRLPSNEDVYRAIPRTPPPPARVGPPPSPPVPTRPVAPVAPEPPGPLALSPCTICGRTFVPQSLSKHVKICEKMISKKRKTFDSSRQRREGTDLEQFLPKNFGLPENSPFLEKSPPNTAKIAPKVHKPSVKNAIRKPMAELQRCPHCSRAFGVRAFERHVEWCADKAKILPATPAPAQQQLNAKQRLNARTQYKAPLVRGRRSSQSHDKSSNSRSASVESSRGVSPPPPRDSGDFRRGRVRASESISSNDYHEDSPHVPVIKNKRGHMSGDANVKARQARLARDLSSSRNTQEKLLSPIQQSNTEPNFPTVQKESNRPKTRLDIKKQQQLKKLEQMANRYNERNQTVQDMDKRRQEKSQIPIPKKKVTASKEVPLNDDANNIIMIESEDIQFSDRNNEINTTKVEIINTRARNKRVSQSKYTSDAIVDEKKKPRVVKKENKVNVKQKPTPLRKKGTNMSVDSLNEPAQTDISNSQSVGINTELLCPCIPCVIHDSESIEKKRSKNKDKSARKEKPLLSEPLMEPKIEFLFKNLSVVSSCDLQPKIQYREEEPMIVESISSLDLNVNNMVKSIEKRSDVTCNKIITTSKNSTKGDLSPSFETVTITKDEYLPPDMDNDIVIDNYSDASFSDSIELVKETHEKISNDQEYNDHNLGCRHGSGDTYTKFSENPDDLQEFMSLTDKMISEQNDNNNDDLFILEEDIQALHTPNTESVETITKILSDSENNEKIPSKPIFSEGLEELKNNFQLLLNEAGDNTVRDAVQINDEGEISKRVSDMEHITVYELKTYERQNIELNTITEQSTDTKLPDISVNNKTVSKHIAPRKKSLRPQKQNRTYQMLCEQNKNNAKNKTFVKFHDEHSDGGLSISSEAPPLKLPRIDAKRIEDNYDPFASAARQMKELMSSETNIPKKIDNSSKNRTLPILRPSKDKTFPADNSKMIKDTLNKSYQKTPTLQRMKSFGSPTNEINSSFGSRCSSFRMSKNNNNKSSQKINTTFTKSSKENISSMDKTYFNRNSSLNRSFSSYTASNYSTPKPKEKIPKIATSLYHSFQRNTIKQPLKLDKIKTDKTKKKDFVNLDVILVNDNKSMSDSNYIDPRLINENDNLPINVTTILNNPDIISSMESLLTTENLPSKFDSFSNSIKNNNLSNKNLLELSKSIEAIANKNSLNKISTVPILDDLNSQYDKILSSLEQSMTSKTSGRDDDSLCEDFDLDEFMTSFDDEVNKQTETKRTCSSTTRIVRTDNIDCNKSEYLSVTPSPQIVSNSNSNGLIPVNKSMSLNFSSNNVVGENLFPSSVKRSTSLLDSLQRKGQKLENARNRQKTDQLEKDIMQSLKDFDKIYETEKKDSNRDVNSNHYTDTVKRAPREKVVRKSKKNGNMSNGNHTPNGKTSSDSAYSSLNRISPSKLSTYNGKDNNGVTSLEQIPAESDSSGKEDARSLSSEEFLAMERSAELEDSLHKTVLHPTYETREETNILEKRSSRPSSRLSSTWRGSGGGALSSSGSESSLRPAATAPRPSTTAPRPSAPAPRPSRFCHECGERFPVDTAKFCIQCGVKRLVV